MLGFVDCTIDWDHIAAYLWQSRLVTSQTGLRSVRQVRAGECIAVGNHGLVSDFYWNPDGIFDRNLAADRCHAMRELRRTVQACVTAWAACYGSILHSLSGGLDSAVVLACLSDTSLKGKVICQNYFTEDGRGDERVFARTAAERARVELIETLLLPDTRALEDMFTSTKFATPAWTRLIPEVESLRESLVEARGIEAVFSGQGGDHFFQSIRSPHIAAEYAWRHGIDKGLYEVIVDTAHFTRRSIWSVMLTVLNSGVLRRHSSQYDTLEPSPLLSDATRNSLLPRHIRHPWIENGKHIPSIKLLQIYNLIDSQNFYSVPWRYADIIHPLISQPVIELALRIPSYVLTYGGRDRALVRDAFSRVVPREIAKRSNKGATTSYFTGLLVRNLPFIRQYLLEGMLVAEGLLSKERAEGKLAERHLMRDSNLISPVLNALRGEAWLRTWRERREQTVA